MSSLSNVSGGRGSRDGRKEEADGCTGGGEDEKGERSTVAVSHNREECSEKRTVFSKLNLLDFN